MRDFARTLGRVLRRPAVVPVPLFALRLALGEMGDAILLASINASADKLQNSGFEFQSRTIDEALARALESSP